MDMKIQIDENWRLKAVRDGWDLERYRALTKGPRVGHKTWAHEGHYDTINWALHAAWRGMIHEGVGTANLEQLIERVNQVESRLLEIAAANLPQTVLRTRKESGVQALSPWERTG